MKKLILIFVILSLLGTLFFAFPVFAEEEMQLFDSAAEADAEEKDYSHLEGTTVSVYNWGEYISDGSEGSLNVIKAFEEKYGIEVQYSTYVHNEEMYAKLIGGGANYDVVIPSDYMIARLIEEELLEKLDFSNIPNYRHIAPEYHEFFFDPTDEYSVPYTVGMVGVIYNTTMVEGEPDSWDLMWDQKYSGQILNFYNPRDVFATAQFLLGLDVNSESEADWNAALDKLLEQKPLIQNYVMDEILNKMEGGEAAIAPYYAGDYLGMHENNSDLAFFYPKEGTNIFVDSMCIPKGAENKEAAELFINFMLEPEIAVENSNFLYYASPNTAVLESDDYELRDNEILYPENPPKVEYFHHLSQETLNLMNRNWDELNISGNSSMGIYIALGIVVALVVVFFVYSAIRKKKRG